MTPKIKWNKKDLNSGRDSSGVANIEGINGTENGISQGYAHGSLTRGLVAYYPMEAGKGEIIRDGALNNLGQIKGSKWANEGKIGSVSLEFGGTDYVNCGFREFLSRTDKTAFTITSWIYIADITKDQVVIGQNRPDETSTEYWTIRCSKYGDGDIAFTLRDDDGDNLEVNTEPGEVTEGSWHLLCVVKKGNKPSELSIFVDGADVTYESQLNQGYSAVSTKGPIYLGNWLFGVDNNRGEGLDGKLSDTKIYDRALSKPEIQTLYNLSQPNGYLLTESDVPSESDGGVSRWKFDDDSGADTAIDSWGENDGDITGAVYTREGVYGENAMSFDGSSDSVTVSSSELDISQSKCVSAWIRMDGPASSQHQRIFQTGTSNSGRAYELWLEDENGEFGRVYFRLNNDQPPNRKGLGYYIPDFDYGEWYHVVSVYDYESGRMILFVNGSLVGSADYSEEVGSATLHTIGNWEENGERPWNGVIDEVRVYDRALTPLQVEKLFKKGSHRISRGDTIQ